MMKRQRWEGVFWGVFFILAAVFLVMSGLGYLPSISIISLLLTIGCVAWMIKSLISGYVEGIFIPAAILCILYAEPLHIEAIVPWTVLVAALLLTVGWSILFHRHKRNQITRWETESIEGEAESDEPVQEASTTDSDSQVYCRASFSGVTKYVNSGDFRHAYISSSFGGAKVYFDHAVIRQKEAEIYVDGSFGGIELFIPKNWKVVNKVRSSFGGVEEKNMRQSDTDQTVILTGRLNFSGVTIYYV